MSALRVSSKMIAPSLGMELTASSMPAAFSAASSALGGGWSLYRQESSVIPDVPHGLDVPIRWDWIFAYNGSDVGFITWLEEEGCPGCSCGTTGLVVVQDGAIVASSSDMPGISISYDSDSVDMVINGYPVNVIIPDIPSGSLLVSCASGVEVVAITKIA